MRWRNLRRSRNIEDRRGGRAASSGQSRRSGGGMGRGMKVGGGGMLLLVLASVFLGQDLTGLLGGGGGTGITQSPQQPTSRGGSTSQLPANDDVAQFVSSIMATTEDVWTPLFQQAGKTYQCSTMVSDQLVDSPPQQLGLSTARVTIRPI